MVADCSHLCVAQVLKNDTSVAPAGTAEHLSEIQALHERAEAFLSVAHGGKGTPTQKKPSMKANQFFLLSLDNALVNSFGWGLQRFLPDNKELWLAEGESMLVRDCLGHEVIDGTAPKRVVAKNALG